MAKPDGKVNKGQEKKLEKGNKGKGKGKDKPKKQKNLHGIVTAVAFEPDVLTVRIKGKAQEFPVSAEASVSLNKEDAEYGDLLEGDNVFLVLDAAGSVIAVDARRDEEEDEEPAPEVPTV